MVHLLREHGAELLTQVNIREITKDGVLYEHAEEVHLDQADQVIIAMGANPNLSLSNAIKAQGIPTSNTMLINPPSSVSEFTCQCSL